MFNQPNFQRFKIRLFFAVNINNITYNPEIPFFIFPGPNDQKHFTHTAKKIEFVKVEILVG